MAAYTVFRGSGKQAKHGAFERLAETYPHLNLNRKTVNSWYNDWTRALSSTPTLLQASHPAHEPVPM